MSVSLVELAQLKDRLARCVPQDEAGTLARFCHLQDVRVAELEIAKRNLITRLAEVWAAPEDVQEMESRPMLRAV